MLLSGFLFPRANDKDEKKKPATTGTNEQAAGLFKEIGGSGGETEKHAQKKAESTHTQTERKTSRAL